ATLRAFRVRRDDNQTRRDSMSQPLPASNDGFFATLPIVDVVAADIDRRSFLVRHAVIGAAAARTGATWSPEARAAQAAKEAAKPIGGGALSPDLDVVKKSK